MYFSTFEKGFYDIKGNGDKKLVTDLRFVLKLSMRQVYTTSMTYQVENDLNTQHLNTLALQSTIGLFY